MLLDAPAPIWPKAAKNQEPALVLRQWITTAQRLERYGEEWISIRARSRPNPKRILAKRQAMQSQETIAFAGLAARHWIDLLILRIPMIRSISFLLNEVRSQQYRERIRVVGGNERNYGPGSEIRWPNDRDRALLERARQMATGDCNEPWTTLQACYQPLPSPLRVNARARGIP